MKLYWLRILLLSTFAFWASGAAKYTHEAIEHHGRDASVDDDDDDDSSAASIVVAAGAPPSTPHDQSKHPAKHACPVCQMLAAMAVDRSAPPALPPLPLELVGRLIVADRVAPVIAAHFHGSARGPPTASI